MEPEAPQETPVPEEPIIELLNEILGQEQTEQVDIDALEKKYCVTSVDRVEKLTAAVLELLARRSKAGEHLKPAELVLALTQAAFIVLQAERAKEVAIGLKDMLSHLGDIAPPQDPKPKKEASPKPAEKSDISLYG
jgi:hypothetical protein